MTTIQELRMNQIAKRLWRELAAVRKIRSTEDAANGHKRLILLLEEAALLAGDVACDLAPWGPDESDPKGGVK
jgi:hypothetical protein